MRQSRQRPLRWALCASAVLAASAPLPSQELEEAAVHPTFRVAVVGATAGPIVDGLAPWTLEVAQPLPDFVDVEVELRLVSRVEACLADPAPCLSTIESVASTPRLIANCGDGLDNDQDGLADLDDPECQRVSAWEWNVATDPSFNLYDHTASGTISDLDVRPPGILDTSGSFGFLALRVERSMNGGLDGITGFVRPSNVSARFLEPVSDVVVLRLFGRVATAALLRGESETAPTHVRVPDTLTRPGGGSFYTSVSLGDVQKVTPGRIDAAIRLRRKEASFLRGDANADGKVNLIDVITLLNVVFRNGQVPCMDAADANDNGELDIGDPIDIVAFVFHGGPELPAPGPRTCGGDPSLDELTPCVQFDGC